jgi:aerobic carbon-monoxide dehydrogenase medium subunit
MKASAVNYARPESLAQVFALLAEYGDSAQILAGGQSLVPMLNLRLAQPDVLVDITRIEGLNGITVNDGLVRIGALVTHHDIEHSALIARHAPLLAKAVPHVAHVAIRHCGTMGGSVALADPAAEYPACLVALDAQVVMSSNSGERRLAASDFFLGIYETALQPGELVTAVEFAASQSGQVFVFSELARRQGDYAMVGLAAVARRDGVGSGVDVIVGAGSGTGGTGGTGGATGTVRLSELRLAFLGAGPTPMLARNAATRVSGKLLNDTVVTAAQDALDNELAPLDDLNAQAATKLHLAKVLLARVLHELAGLPKKLTL